MSDTGAYHVGGEGVPEAVRVREGHSSGLAMITEQRAQSCRRHPGTASWSFQRNKERVRVEIASFQP
jgi:hypothetical protein